MENEVMVYEGEDTVPAIADDNLLRVAEMAERRIDAVVKIKQMALKVTNASDWTDQGGKPYLQVSGSEKVANLFNISWRLDEPTVDTEPDGHFTYTMRGIFSIPGRSISAEGSRSSKDPFFKKYDWVNGKKVEKPITSIDRRDVRMAALTNLLGNGITRLLGIRNLTYEDLDAFAGIKKEDVSKIDYKGKGQDKPPIQQPGKKPTEEKKPSGEAKTISGPIESITSAQGQSAKGPWTRYDIIIDGMKFSTFSDTTADMAHTAESAGSPVTIEYIDGQRGNTIKTLTVNEEREPGAEG